MPGNLTAPRGILLAGLLALAAPAALAAAAAQAPDAGTIIRAGNGHGAPPCQACHGIDGAGQPAAGFPRLAGLNATYLRKQLDDLASGSRVNAVMGPTAKALDSAERAALAEYYSKLPPPAAPATPLATMPAADSVGAWLANRGRWSVQVPACIQCHGPAGVGVGANFPPLAGQSATYIEAQLKAWRQGSRHNDPLQLMQHISKSLSEQDVAAVAAWFAAQSPDPRRLPPAAAATSTPPATDASIHAAAAAPAVRVQGGGAFTPPPESSMPAGPFGDAVRRGRDIFRHTPQLASAYVGNGLTCSNCHLDAGRRAHSAPLWGAYGVYPQYRAKNGHVNTLGERIQGCFKFSMNGKPPALDSAEMVALESYAHWLASGAPVGVRLAGAGYPKQGFKPPQPPDYARGQVVFERSCALCHGADGQGRRVAGRYVFPPLWGADSFNWGAGMHQLDNAAAFIKANMPLSRGDTLDDQDAWDVAMYMDGHERPQDPRYRGNLEQTRRQYHDSPMSLYGTTVAGHLLGSRPAKP